ncbi:MAG: threonylcarbamoyl-AMP synthase [Alphaproteobacteria bacterium]|nr:threonylcarbamoyl-AMP synthase [Alphaproteobacteria bacterium]
MPVLIADRATIARAADLLRAGRLVAFPTETVYGLGADATNEQAVAGIFAAKGRPAFNPLIVHVQDLMAAEQLGVFSDVARQLAQRFWPGALTLVVPRRPDCRLSLLVSAGLDTVALRVPSATVVRALLEESGLPIAAPSANRSGRISPTTAAHVDESLASRVDLILDAGPTQLGLESTVIGCAGDVPVLLRPGAIAREEIEETAGPLHRAAGTIQSPGQLASHYAPRATLRLRAHSVDADEALIGFGANVPAGAKQVFNLSERADLREAAANLFAMLRAADAVAARIAVMPIPAHGLGEAINDRLARAATPRDEP